MNSQNILLLLTLLGSACKQPNSNYCEDAPLHNCKNEVDAAVACSSNESCMAPTGVCDLAGSKTCVECTTAEDAACVGAKPVCGANHACRKCEQHSECDSQVCLADGSCAAPATVAYVDGAAPAGNAACSLVAKCNTVTKALAANKAIVKVTGTVDDRVALVNRNVQLIGDSGAKITSSGNGTLLTIGGSSVVTVQGLDLVDASGPAIGNGMVVQAGATGSIVFTHGRIQGSREFGVQVNPGSALVTISHATISGNLSGGISVMNAPFKIFNNMIFRNGNPDTAAFGGVSLMLSAAGQNVFAFNTIVDNRSQSGVLRAGGVICSEPTFNADNNIVARNQNGASASAATSQTLGDCVFRTSRVQNDVAGLNFTSPEVVPYDYHLGGGSVAIDAGTTSTTVKDDYDGDVRPLGAAADQGADEFKP